MGVWVSKQRIVLTLGSDLTVRSYISRSTAKSPKCVGSKKRSARELPVTWSKVPYTTDRIAPQNKRFSFFSLLFFHTLNEVTSIRRYVRSARQAGTFRPISLTERVTGNPAWHHSLKSSHIAWRAWLRKKRRGLKGRDDNSRHLTTRAGVITSSEFRASVIFSLYFTLHCNSLFFRP